MTGDSGFFVLIERDEYPAPRNSAEGAETAVDRPVCRTYGAETAIFALSVWDCPGASE